MGITWKLIDIVICRWHVGTELIP